MIQSLIPIALGGALGSVLRFLTVVDNPVGVPPLQQHATEADVPDDAELADKED